MGLGRLFAGGDETRSTRYTVTDTVTGQLATYTVVDNLAPDWPSSDAYRGGMSIPGAWRAAMLLSDLLGSVPYDAYRKPQVAEQDEEIILPRPPLLEQPCDPDTAMTTFSSWALDLIWHGNGMAVISDRNWAGTPTACVPVEADAVSVRRVKPNDPESIRPPGSIEYKIGDLVFGSEDMIHIKGPCRPGALRGMGVLEAHLTTFNLARDQARQVQGIAQHGVPSGLLKSENPDLDDAEADDMKLKWMQAQATRTVAVLNSVTEFQAVSWNPDQLQLVQARQMTINELELVFGLPVGWLGGMNSARQYSNIEQDAINLLKFSLSGHLNRFEDTFSLLYPRGTMVRANLDAILRADTLTRYQAHEIALKNHFLTVAEVRRREHLPPIDEKELLAQAELMQALMPAPAIGGGNDSATQGNGGKPAPGSKPAGGSKPQGRV